MTMRFLGRAALPAAAVLATLAIAVPASGSPAGLPHLDITGVYVTGVSSGGFMATQLQVAYSGTFDGAGPTTAARGTSSASPPAT
jgi:poly(3-hydroxybutyrate) depolymerase